ncbi:hypothetical protein D9M69_394010 [compost metagenome]
MVNTTATETGLGHHEGLADATENMVGRHPYIIETHVGVSVDFLRGEAGIPNDFDARSTGRDDEHRLAGDQRSIGIGHDHDDEEFSKARVRGEPFLAIDHPLVTVTHGNSGEDLRVGPALRLGHREAGNDFAGQQRLQPTLLLLGGAEVSEDLGVTAVRCLATEHDRCELRASEDFVHQAQFDLTEARATQLGAEMAGPQAARLDLGLQGPDQTHIGRVLHVVGAIQHVIERLDASADEFIDPVELRLKLGIGFKRPTHQ